jgi:cell division initiation protein
MDFDSTKLATRFRGYDKEEVDRLLLNAAETLTRVLDKNQQLEEEVDRLKVETEALKKDQRLVQEALIGAQRTAEEVRASAHKQGGQIIEEARQLSQAEKAAAREKVEEMLREIDQLRHDRKRYIDDFRMILERHLRELNTLQYGEPREVLSA